MPRATERRQPEQYNVYGEAVSGYGRAGGRRAGMNRQGGSGYGGVTLQRPEHVMQGVRLYMSPSAAYIACGRKSVPNAHSVQRRFSWSQARCLAACLCQHHAANPFTAVQVLASR